MSTATEKLEDVADEGKEKVSGNGDGSLAKKFLLPAAAGVGAIAAGYAAKKAPDIFSEQVMPKLQDRGSDEAAKMGKQAMGKMTEGSSGVAGKVAGSVVSKVTGGGGGKGKKTRRLPIQRWTDVAVPVDKAYEAWTQWEEWPKFMHRVLEVKPDEEDDNKIHVSEKIWFWTREWDSEITEQRKNDRIAWKTDGGMQHSGVVSFHKLDDNLTRVMVDMDFLPTGMIEKMASGMRFVKRAVQSDLARFKAYVEFGDAKELEYKSTPAEMEQNQEGGDDDEQQGSGDSQETQSSGDDSSSGDDRDSERERAERESRREERRKAMASGRS